VIAVTAGVDSVSAARAALPYLAPGVLYVDLSTMSGDETLDRAYRRSGGRRNSRRCDHGARCFTRTPYSDHDERARSRQICGDRRRLGMDVTDLGGAVGDAATRKLLRSVLVKGLSTLVIESMRAADRLGLGAWFEEHLLSTVSEADERFCGAAADRGRRAQCPARA